MNITRVTPGCNNVGYMMEKLAINGGQPIRTQPFPSWPVWDSGEINAVREVLESGGWGYPRWQCVPRFEEHFAAFHDARYGICFNSGTSALTGALWAVGVQPGDEVILPAYTFIATATAVVQLGAVPVFADIEQDSFHLDARSVEEKVTPKTKAVVAVHIGGRPADMTRLKNVCEYCGIPLVEDAAQAWGSEWRNVRVGAIGDAGIFSFQSSKNITAGEGGIVLTNDEEVAAMCRTYCNCGRREDKPRYEHYYIGGNYRMSELQAAVLQVQFERYPEQMQLRMENADFLNDELTAIPGIRQMNSNEDITANSCHLYLMRYDNKHFEELSKQVFIEALQKEGIPVSPGYTIPVYRQPVFANGTFGACGKPLPDMPDYSLVSLPETEKACNEQGVWLTQNVLLGSELDMEDIAAAFRKLKEYAGELK